MEKLSIKKIITFRSKSEKSKKSFALALKKNKKAVELEGGGDYWVSSLSAISNGYKSNDLQPIIDKRHELEVKYGKTDFEKTKNMYKRNINILYNFEDIDFNKWRPSKKLNLLRKRKEYSVLTVNGMQVQATPHHVFTFQHNNVEEIGAIWFVSKLNGFREEELGMFTDILYIYLNHNFSATYRVNAQYCISIDVFNNREVNYIQLEQGKVPSILNSTLKEIKDLM